MAFILLMKKEANLSESMLQFDFVFFFKSVLNFYREVSCHVSEYQLYCDNIVI